MAGIIHVRLPVGYWMMETNEELVSEGVFPEPWVHGGWVYVERLVTWAAQHWVKVLIDLHGIPGSQNGFDNSGRRGSIRWQENAKNVARSLRCISRIAEQLSRHPRKEAIYGIQLVNEPAFWGIDIVKLRQYYIQGYFQVRHHFADPWSCAVVIHDAFLPLDAWTGFMSPQDGFENVILDTHRYHVFDDGMLSWTPQQHVAHAAAQADAIRKSDANLWTIVGEWSLATTDCAQWLNGYGVGSRWTGDHPSRVGKGPIRRGATCNKDNDPTLVTMEDKTWLATFFQVQSDAYSAGRGWFFWTVKTEGNHAWDYFIGLRQGWIPRF